MLDTGAGMAENFVYVVVVVVVVIVAVPVDVVVPVIVVVVVVVVFVVFEVVVAEKTVDVVVVGQIVDVVNVEFVQGWKSEASLSLSLSTKRQQHWQHWQYFVKRPRHCSFSNARRNPRQHCDAPNHLKRALTL